MTANAALPPFVVAGRIDDRQPTRESDSRGQAAYSSLVLHKMAQNESLYGVRWAGG